MKRTRVFVAGHRGMVGSAIIRKLALDNTLEIVTRSRAELDLVVQKEVQDFFLAQAIDQVYVAAARVGGIVANNSYPAEFIYENIMIQTNIIHAAHISGVQKLLFLGSSCIYPKFATQPMNEKSLLTGALEDTNEPYAIAKIAGIKLCESYSRQYGRDYRSVMPTNLYGPHDNFHPKNSHVIPGLIRRFHDAKVKRLPEVEVWGTGKPMREFLYVDDMADATVHVMNLDRTIYEDATAPTASQVNIGTGVDCSIRELAETLANIVGYRGQISFNPSKPDGTPRKLLDVSRIKSLGWDYRVSLEEGLRRTYAWFLANPQSYRGEGAASRRLPFRS